MAGSTLASPSANPAGGAVAAGTGAAGVWLPPLAAVLDGLLFLWLEGALARWEVLG